MNHYDFITAPNIGIKLRRDSPRDLLLIKGRCAIHTTLLVQQLLWTEGKLTTRGLADYHDVLKKLNADTMDETWAGDYEAALEAVRTLQDIGYSDTAFTVADELYRVSDLTTSEVPVTLDHLRVLEIDGGEKWWFEYDGEISGSANAAQSLIHELLKAVEHTTQSTDWVVLSATSVEIDRTSASGSVESITFNAFAVTSAGVYEFDTDLIDRVYGLQPRRVSIASIPGGAIQHRRGMAAAVTGFLRHFGKAVGWDVKISENEASDGETYYEAYIVPSSVPAAAALHTITSEWVLNQTHRLMSVTLANAKEIPSTIDQTEMDVLSQLAQIRSFVRVGIYRPRRRT